MSKHPYDSYDPTNHLAYTDAASASHYRQPGSQPLPHSQPPIHNTNHYNDYPTSHNHNPPLHAQMHPISTATIGRGERGGVSDVNLKTFRQHMSSEGAVVGGNGPHANLPHHSLPTHLSNSKGSGTDMASRPGSRPESMLDLPNRIPGSHLSPNTMNMNTIGTSNGNPSGNLVPNTSLISSRQSTLRALNSAVIKKGTIHAGGNINGGRDVLHGVAPSSVNGASTGTPSAISTTIGASSGSNPNPNASGANSLGALSAIAPSAGTNTATSAPGPLGNYFQHHQARPHQPSQPGSNMQSPYRVPHDLTQSSLTQPQAQTYSHQNRHLNQPHNYYPPSQHSQLAPLAPLSPRPPHQPHHSHHPIQPHLPLPSHVTALSQMQIPPHHGHGHPSTHAYPSQYDLSRQHLQPHNPHSNLQQHPSSYTAVTKGNLPVLDSSLASTYSDVVPNDHDVLSGRGVNIAHHPGNERFRSLITTYQDQNYCTSYSATEKRAVALEIIEHIKALDPPGRFLKRHGRGQVARGLQGPWEELSEREAIKKTCQALRDCNRTDRTGYAIGVCAPGDVVDVARQANETGMSTKERARKAAEKISVQTNSSLSSKSTQAESSEVTLKNGDVSASLDTSIESGVKRKRHEHEDTLSSNPGASAGDTNGNGKNSVTPTVVDNGANGGISVVSAPCTSAAQVETSGTKNATSSAPGTTLAPHQLRNMDAQYPDSSGLPPMIPARSSLSQSHVPQASPGMHLPGQLPQSYFPPMSHPSYTSGHIVGGGGIPFNGNASFHPPHPTINPRMPTGYEEAMAIEPTGALAAQTHPYTSILNSSQPRVLDGVTGLIGEDSNMSGMSGKSLENMNGLGLGVGVSPKTGGERTQRPPNIQDLRIHAWPKKQRSEDTEPSVTGTSVSSTTSNCNGVRATPTNITMNSLDDATEPSALFRIQEEDETTTKTTNNERTNRRAHPSSDDNVDTGDELNENGMKLGDYPSSRNTDDDSLEFESI